MAEKFDHKNCWYPVAFLRDVAVDSMMQFSVHDEEFVLLRGSADNLMCLRDRCPHRAAKLSTGKMKGDVIECQYHGWQFDFNGRCVRIPQLLPGTEIPERACVESFTVVSLQGIVWFWAGDRSLADVKDIRTIPDLDMPDIYIVDYMVDLPYDQSYLIENVIDVAHIHVAHDGIRGGGRRELALPLEFTIRENSASGIKAQYKSIGLPENANSPLKAAHVEFVAPNLVNYVSEYKDESRISGLALYSLPLGKRRCRLIYRKYSNFYSWKERIRPRWLEHHIHNTILQQDMAIIMGQYQAVEESDQELHELWLPNKSCDQLVLAYRRWLDDYGQNLPFYRGYRTSRMPSTSDELNYPSNSYQIHTQNCTDCSRMHQLSVSLKTWLAGASMSLALLAIYVNSTPLKHISLSLVVLFVCALPMLSRFKKMFE